VIGINTAMIAGAQGICFAVASNTASYVVSEIIRHGRVRRAYIGIGASTIPLQRRVSVAFGLQQSQGVAVSDIAGGSPAERAGLKVGDIIIALDRETVSGADDLIRLLSAERIGAATSITVLSGAEMRTLTVTPGERPD
jgi:S1-C subfamily serine protease